MSRRPEYFGGSPGPPIVESVSSHHAPLNRYGQFPTRNQVYRSAVGGYDVSPRGMNGNNLVYFAQDGSLMQHNFAYDANPSYPYGPSIDAFYYGAPAFYYTHDGQPVAQQFVTNSNQYPEWSSTDLASASNMSPPDVLDETNGSSTPDNRSSSNDSGGKSRRFSRQRNVKDSDNTNSRKEVGNRRQFRNVPKHEIRFSHQRKQPGEDNEVKQDASQSNVDVEKKEQDVNSRFSIIHSIGKREIDSGYRDPEHLPKEETQKPADARLDFKPKPTKKKSEKLPAKSNESQLSLLLEQLTSGKYECMVCCDRVKQHHAIWNCGKCYHVFHMGCIKKWARSPAAHVEGEGWRCPGCRSISKKFPSTYKCYCEKVNEPEWNRRETPHSCGEVCGKKRSNNATCTHPCNILCHPGPCPPCPASVIKPCLCGKMSRKVRCSQQKPLMCTEKCGKMKNCSLHECEVVCHSGDCNLCDVLVNQTCFCEKGKREVLCGSDEFNSSKHQCTNQVYSCGKTCEKLLVCGNHYCEQVCHEGDCKPCPLLPSLVTTCPCTQTKLSEITNSDGRTLRREHCTDAIPTCGKICGKPLKCGGDEVHTCQLTCHTGPCPPCADNTSTIHCRCGKSEDDVPCAEIPEDAYICDRRCNKKRKCGRHKCGKTCCTDTEHQCAQICGRKLECKLHRCEETCHRGNCHTCYNVSFDELSCHCGAEVMFPPIPCGTRPPECTRPCMRQHSCFHEVNHNCHNEDKCPPCVVLMKKQCNCGRIMRKNIPCYQANVSCGAQCKKVLQCGHNCMKPCHQGPCMESEERCTQPCSIMRVECIHPCATSCHQGKPCPTVPCKAMVTLKCTCGNREMQVECSTHHRLSSEALARQQAGSVDIGSLLHGPGKQKVLPCNEQCFAIERNKRLAEAFEISEQNAGEVEQHTYSSFLLMWAKQDSLFVKGIEQELSNLIDTISWLDKTKRSHTFPSMKREKRQVVHEMAEVFHCKSISIDEEPNRSVMVTAVRGVSKIPRSLLSDITAKKPVDASISKYNTPHPNSSSSSDNNKRLLKSMKLVSLTSASPDREHLLQSQTSKRPASIPRMPTYSSVGKQANSVSVPKTSSDAVRDLTKSPYGDTKMGHPRLPSTTFRSSVANATSKRTNSLTSATKKEKDEPDIDYFDMTG